jgi:hypothetical protein
METTTTEVSASEKLDIVRLVEGSHLPVKHPSAG